MRTKEYVVYAIYAANDITREYRYVGITSNLSARGRSHKLQSQYPSGAAYQTPKSKWMRRHLNLVKFDVLEKCDDDTTLKWAEMKWIHILRQRGYRLLNLTDGGEGTFGWVPGIEWRHKQSQRMSDRDTNKTMFKAGNMHPAYGKSRSVDTKRKMAEGKIGLKNPKCKLTVEQIRQIRERRNSGESPLILMEEFDVSRKTVYRIAKGVRYSDI